MRSLRGWSKGALGLGLGVGLALTGIAPVSASTATNTFTVTANIVAACTVSATNLGFGPYSPSGGTAVTSNSTINTFCTSGTSYTLSLNIGTGGGTFAARKMANGSSLMSYNLYTTSALSTVWGDGTNSTGTVTGTGTGLLTASPTTVYGSIPTGQDLPTGGYTSTVTVTVTY